MNTPPIQEEIQIPLERVAKFIRQLTHDVRNGLSAADLEAAFIEEISTDEEVLSELRKLREMISDTAKMLRRVSQYFQPAAVHPIQWEAKTLVRELQNRIETEFPEQFSAIQIVDDFEKEIVEIDLEQTLAVITLVLQNALEWMKEGGRVSVKGILQAEEAIIEIHEPKPDKVSDLPPGLWGTEPLYSTRPGGYGLGLFLARKIALAQGSKLEIRVIGNELVTRLTLPKPKAPM